MNFVVVVFLMSELCCYYSGFGTLHFSYRVFHNHSLKIQVPQMKSSFFFLVYMQPLSIFQTSLKKKHHLISYKTNITKEILK